MKTEFQRRIRGEKMGDVMTFPETMEEFLAEYSFKDSEEIYTNGAMLIPVFRVRQMIKHYMEEDRE